MDNNLDMLPEDFEIPDPQEQIKELRTALRHARDLMSELYSSTTGLHVRNRVQGDWLDDSYHLRQLIDKLAPAPFRG